MNIRGWICPLSLLTQRVRATPHFDYLQLRRAARLASKAGLDGQLANYNSQALTSSRVLAYESLSDAYESLSESDVAVVSESDVADVESASESEI